MGSCQVQEFEILPQNTALVALVSNRVVLPGTLRAKPGTIIFSPESGKILLVLSEKAHEQQFPSQLHSHLTYHDVSPNIIMPGLIDAHVHLNEPGPRTAWEGFDTGTKAAITGGVTTVIDMPLNSVPSTVTVAALAEKMTAAKGKTWCDVGFYGGVVPSNVGCGELLKLIRRGVRGFKGFLVDSGVAEFPAITSTDIQLAMSELKDANTTLMFHAEMIPPIADSIGDDVQTSIPPLAPTGPLHSYRTFLDSRPAEMETAAIAQILSCAHLAPRLPLHIVHLSAIEAVPLLREARNRGVKVTSETCYHYLSLISEDVRDGDARFKCCPPVRSQSNQDGLWNELLQEDSVIKTVVSDHSPCTVDLKLLPRYISGSKPQTSGGTKLEALGGDFFKAWGGVSSLGLGLSILNTERINRRTFDFGDIVRWCAVNTAKQVGLERRKGSLAKGMDADICIFDDDSEIFIEHSNMHFRNKCSPYEGKKFRGVVKQTWLAGKKIYDSERRGLLLSEGPRGRLLLDPR